MPKYDLRSSPCMTSEKVTSRTRFPLVSKDHFISSAAMDEKNITYKLFLCHLMYI